MDAIAAFDLERGVKFEISTAPLVSAVQSSTNSVQWTGFRAWSAPVPTNSTAPASNSKLSWSRMSPPTKRCAKLCPQGADGRVPEKMASRMPASSAWFQALPQSGSKPDSNKDVREIDVLEDKRGADPVREIQRKDLKELITKGLSRAERLIIILYYFEEMTMKRNRRAPHSTSPNPASARCTRPFSPDSKAANGRQTQGVPTSRGGLVHCHSSNLG